MLVKIGPERLEYAAHTPSVQSENNQTSGRDQIHFAHGVSLHSIHQSIHLAHGVSPRDRCVNRLKPSAIAAKDSDDEFINVQHVADQRPLIAELLQRHSHTLQPTIVDDPTPSPRDRCVKPREVGGGGEGETTG